MITTQSRGLGRRRSASERGPLDLGREGVSDLLSRRRLIRRLIAADLKRTHIDTVFGQLWWILDPLLQMVVYSILVTIIFRRTIPDYPLFIFAGILPWKWFSTTLNDAMGSVINRQSLIRQVQFPKVVLPTAATLAGGVGFCFGLIALGFMYIPYLDRLTPYVLFVPVVAAVQLVLTLALAVMLSAVNAYYRDVANIMRHVLRLWFYLTPILYPVIAVPEGTILRLLVDLNPFTTLVVNYRAVIYGTPTGAPQGLPDLGPLVVLAVISCGLVGVSIAFFKRVEPGFARIL
jgi:ABC-type polysaccharide/polyol phosphate export permease